MLKVSKINKKFDKKVVFKDFSYDFAPAALYVLRGDSGVGKTTLLRIISGLDTDFTGEISPRGLSFSYAFQEYRLFPSLTALENVLYAAFDIAGDKERELAKNELLRLGFSEEDTALYPSELSGGMKQRVSLARAFLRDSDVLLLDEPTKELDAALATTVKSIILEQAKKRTVIVVSHDEDDFSKDGATVIRLTNQN